MGKRKPIAGMGLVKGSVENVYFRIGDYIYMYGFNISQLQRVCNYYIQCMGFWLSIRFMVFKKIRITTSMVGIR